MVDENIEQRVAALTNAIAQAIKANADIHDANGFADIMCALQYVVVGAYATVGQCQHDQVLGAMLFAEQCVEVIAEDSPAVLGLFAVRQ